MNLGLLGCSADDSDSAGRLGNLGLLLEIDGVELNYIDYAITHPNVPPLTGVIDVREKGPGIRIGGLPAATDYTLSLGGKTEQGHECSGTTTFSVVADQVTPVSIEVECRVPGTQGPTGGVQVDGTVKVVENGNKACGGAQIVAAPYSCPVGQPVALTSTPVSGVTGALTYSWKSGDQEISTQANASFQCEVAGNFTISLAVSGEGCTLQRQLEVSCVDNGSSTGTGSTTEPSTGSCGDGNKDDGEECDDGNKVNEDACTNACKLARCGDGFVQAGEACDDGNDVETDECLNNCTLPTSIWRAGDDCRRCMKDKCSAEDAACSLDATCQSIVACELDKMCLNGFSGALPCLCGPGASMAACQQVQGTDYQGACAGPILDGLGTRGDAEKTLIEFLNPATGVGKAHVGFGCMIASCFDECGENLMD